MSRGKGLYLTAGMKAELVNEPSVEQTALAKRDKMNQVRVVNGCKKENKIIRSDVFVFPNNRTLTYHHIFIFYHYFYHMFVFN